MITQCKVFRKYDLDHPMKFKEGTDLERIVMEVMESDYPELLIIMIVDYTKTKVFHLSTNDKMRYFISCDGESLETYFGQALVDFIKEIFK